MNIDENDVGHIRRTLNNLWRDVARQICFVLKSIFHNSPIRLQDRIGLGQGSKSERIGMAGVQLVWVFVDQKPSADK